MLKLKSLKSRCRARRLFARIHSLGITEASPRAALRAVLRVTLNGGSFVALLVSLGVLIPASAQQPTSFVVDDFGHRVAPIPNTEQARIVALAPHLCELAHTAGVGERLIGVSNHCDYPPSVARLPRVANYRSIDFEQLAQLQPNLILVWKANLRDRHHLSRLRLITPRVFVSDPHDFRAVADNLIAIGRLSGRGDIALREAEEFISEINALRHEYSNRTTLKILYLIHSPPPVTVNGQHWISRLLTACGATNIFAEAPTQVVHINAESLLLNPPDLVVHSMPSSPTLTGHALGGLGDAPVFYIHADLVQRPTTRLIDGVRQLCAIVDAQRPIVQRRDRDAN